MTSLLRKLSRPGKHDQAGGRVADVHAHELTQLTGRLGLAGLATKAIWSGFSVETVLTML